MIVPPWPRRHVICATGAPDVPPQQLARIWGNALYRVVFADDDTERTAYCCTACFCSHARDRPYEREHGLLSQWRGYGKDGGFCLVFDTAKLWGLFEKERDAFFYAYTDVRKAFYPREPSKQIECFTELLDTSESVIKTALLENRDFSVDQTLLPFVSSATAFKHQGFHEEREVRLVAMAGTKLAADIVREAGQTPAPLKEVHRTIRDGRERRHIARAAERGAQDNPRRARASAYFAVRKRLRGATVKTNQSWSVGVARWQCRLCPEDRWRKGPGLQIGNTLHWLRLHWPRLANDLYQIGEPRSGFWSS
jgi:hypothetical protein